MNKTIQLHCNSVLDMFPNILTGSKSATEKLIYSAYPILQKIHLTAIKKLMVSAYTFGKYQKVFPKIEFNFPCKLINSPIANLGHIGGASFPHPM